MATRKVIRKKPQRERLALTISNELRVALMDAADALGKPPSTVATSLLEEIIPQLEGLAKLARATQAGNKAAAKRALVHMVGDGMAELMRQQQPEMFPKPRVRK